MLEEREKAIGQLIADLRSDLEWWASNKSLKLTPKVASETVTFCVYRLPPVG